MRTSKHLFRHHYANERKFYAFSDRKKFTNFSAQSNGPQAHGNIVYKPPCALPKNKKKMKMKQEESNNKMEIIYGLQLKN